MRIIKNISLIIMMMGAVVLCPLWSIYSLTSLGKLFDIVIKYVWTLQDPTVHMNVMEGVICFIFGIISAIGMIYPLVLEGFVLVKGCVVVFSWFEKEEMTK